jgi:hypothetical protein
MKIKMHVPVVFTTELRECEGSSSRFGCLYSGEIVASAGYIYYLHYTQLLTRLFDLILSMTKHAYKT